MKFSKISVLTSLTILIFFTNIISPTTLVNNSYAFSVGDEKKVGEKLFSIVRKEFKLFDDPDITQYVNSLGQNILKVAGHQFFDYHFFVINNKDFNAFAAPSGLVFIHSGLIEAMSNEGELVSVMAHECAHVTSRHISNRIKKTRKTSIGSAALLIAGIALGGGAIAEALITGSMAAGASMNLKFSRQDEEEADRLAFKWMNAMDMDPAPMDTMLQKMYKVSVYRMANIPPFLLTHPLPKQRMGYVQDLIIGSDRHTYPPRDDFNFLRIKSRIMSMTKEPAALRQVYFKELKKGKEPQRTMANYGLYLAYMDEADYEKAGTYLKKVISAYPSRNILQTDLGLLTFKKGQKSDAIILLEQAHTSDPDCAYTTFNLALMLQQRGSLGQALKLYKSMLSTTPDYAKLHFNIGNLETKTGRPAAGHYHLGYYFWLEGDNKVAKYHLQKAVQDGGGEKEAAFLAKKMLKKLKELEKD